MAMNWQILAAGGGWRVTDIRCDAGPHDRPFEEQHEAVCIAAVTEGSFQYRSSHGTALLAPGALLLGNDGQPYECGHEHAAGDRSLCFHFDPDYLEDVVAAVPGASRTVFTVPRLPPLPGLMPLLADAEAARDRGETSAFEELALRLAGAVAAELAGSVGHPARRPTARDQRRITRALRRIESGAGEALALAVLARDAAMSPYHFLRTFDAVVGMTPHQYLLRTRLHRTAVRLRRTREPIASIAFDAGFNDLSTFNHRFRRLMGATPSAYRAGRLPTVIS
jgi:AraC family transcriptional regulator